MHRVDIDVSFAKHLSLAHTHAFPSKSVHRVMEGRDSENKERKKGRERESERESTVRGALDEEGRTCIPGALSRAEDEEHASGHAIAELFQVLRYEPNEDSEVVSQCHV